MTRAMPSVRLSPGRATVLRNEIAKCRHLRLGLVTALLAVGIVGLTLVGTLAGASTDGGLTAALPLAGLSLAVPVVSPVVLAILASRAVDIEHQGGGWLLNRTTGVAPGRLCRAKLGVLAAAVAVGTGGASVLVAVLTRVVGATGPVPVSLWLGHTVAAIVVSLVVLAVQVLISARVDNQLIPLGVGIVGTVVAIAASGLPGWVAHLTPWGYWSLIAAADYAGESVVTLQPSYVSVVALALLAIAGVVVATRRLDRQEV